MASDTTQRQAGRETVLLLLPAVVAVLTFAVTGTFALLATLDDHYYLTANSTVTSFSWGHFKEAFSSFYVGNYAPLHILSYMADHALWGLNPAGYHLENVAWHALNGLLFSLLLRRLGMTGWQAATAGWIFLLHPVQVETVAWVSQRKTLLAMCFFLGALHAYHSYLVAEAERWRFYLLAVASVAAAMLSKSVAVIFPAVAFLYDQASATFPPRSPGKRLADKLPFVAVAATIAVLALISQDQDAGGGRRDYPGGSPLATFFTMVPVLAGYIRDCFWPVQLLPHYDVTIRLQPDPTFFLSLLFLAGIGGAGFLIYRRQRPLLVWYGLFFIALLPVLQIVPLITLKNDRYLYFSLPGFAVVVVAATGMLYRRLPGRIKVAALALGLGMLLVLPVLTFRQIMYWQNDITLWTHLVRVDPASRMGWMQLMKSHTGQGNSREALDAFNRYTQLKNIYGPVRGFEGE